MTVKKMDNPHKTGFLKLFVTLIAFHSLQFGVHCTEFNRNVTGVAFSAYVRSIAREHDPSEDWQRYTRDDIKTMLTVISGKFSNVATFGVGSSNVRYQESMTYHQSFAQVYSAEAAAILNKDENSKKLSVLIGVWIFSNPRQMNTEVQLGLESFRKANSIYPGTAWGLVFSENDIATNLFQAQTTLLELQKLKMEAERVNLKLGSRQNCQGINSLSDQNDRLAETRRNIVKMSDFIICVLDSAHYGYSLGASIGFDQVKQDLLQYRENMRQINPSIEVMGQTGFSTAGSTPAEVVNLRNYWEIVDKWAAENNFPMWLFEAFDNPWKKWDPWAAHYGWWHLRRNEDVGKVEGYIEKISLLPATLTTTTTPKTPRMPRKDDEDEKDTKNAGGSDATTSVWTFVAVAISSIVAFSVLCLFIKVYRRVNKLRAVLTKEEVKQFRYGDISKVDATPNPGIGGGVNSPVETVALAKPYDKSYEICKDNFEIFWNSILGTGQFGCVYKAILIVPHTGRVEIALKVAKTDVPKIALKSLLNEIKILTYLGKHSNLVSLKGAYTAEIQSGVVYVATEFCELGSLKGFLVASQRIRSRKNTNSYTDLIGNDNGAFEQLNDKNTKDCITLQEMIRWSYEIACGMEYLGKMHVIHADLATRNVLLTSDKTAKITDFGLSRRLYEYTNYMKTRQEPLPWRWMSIEALRKLEFSSQSDVWSYGVTLWEIFSMGDVPYPGLSWTLDFVTSLENGLRMKCPQYATPEIFPIMSACWQDNGHDRPTFTELKSKIAYILENCKK